MARSLRREDDNIYIMPTGSNVVKSGAVYMNSTSYRVEPKDGRKPYTSHKKICIGVVYVDAHGKRTNKMYANANYYRMFLAEKLPDPPAMADSLSVGPRLLTETIGKAYGLVNLLTDVFGEEDTCLIMDLASYMLVEEKAVFQHFPAWARRHALYSECIRSDSYISMFLGERLTHSKIDLFKVKWARRHIGSGKLYFCYDSTNTNSRAEGVYLVQKGHAKDDPSVPQVNSDYVVRQEDGLPFSFMEFPGSVTDIAQAPTMISFLKGICEGMDVNITLVCDRGYISEDNVRLMDECGMGFLLMLKSNMSDHSAILDEYADRVKNRFENYISESDEFGMTVERQLFGKGPARFFHILWSQTLELAHRAKLIKSIETKRKELLKAIERKKRYTDKELDSMPDWFILTVKESEAVNVKVRGGEKKAKAYIITDIEEDLDGIAKEMGRCGFYLLVTSEKMTAGEARKAYSKRDCVEKVFRALKSSLGMDEIGVSSDENLHGKTLLWFVAAILHSALFSMTSSLRVNDKKNFSVPAQIDRIDAITADRNLSTEKYKRRYKLDKKQNDILNACGASLPRLDEIIDALPTQTSC